MEDRTQAYRIAELEAELEKAKRFLLQIMKGHCANNDRVFCGTCSDAQKYLGIYKREVKS